jgi:hypothetical protein
MKQQQNPRLAACTDISKDFHPRLHWIVGAALRLEGLLEWMKVSCGK